MKKFEKANIFHNSTNVGNLPGSAAEVHNGNIKREGIIAAAKVAVIVLLILSVIVLSAACTNRNIEIVQKPAFAIAYNSQKGGIIPTVAVVVKNTSDKPIKCMFHCYIYDGDGNRTTTVSSQYEMIMPGESVTIKGTSSDVFSTVDFYEKCVKIDNVTYDVI